MKKLIVFILSSLAGIIIYSNFSNAILNEYEELIIIKNDNKPINETLTRKINNIIQEKSTVIKHIKQIQEKAKQNKRDLSNNHDNEHPREHLSEWDSIKNKNKICWYHKKTKKKVCEKIN